jgi:hypothetical protein
MAQRDDKSNLITAGRNPVTRGGKRSASVPVPAARYGFRRKPNTAAAYGFDLKNLFEFLEARTAKTAGPVARAASGSGPGWP